MNYQCTVLSIFLGLFRRFCTTALEPGSEGVGERNALERAQSWHPPRHLDAHSAAGSVCECAAPARGHLSLGDQDAVKRPANVDRPSDTLA